MCGEAAREHELLGPVGAIDLERASRTGKGRQQSQVVQRGRGESLVGVVGEVLRPQGHSAKQEGPHAMIEEIVGTVGTRELGCLLRQWRARKFDSRDLGWQAGQGIHCGTSSGYRYRCQGADDAGQSVPPGAVDADVVVHGFPKNFW